MHVHIEFVFRPRNRFHRFLAWIIGAPTMGILRAGEHEDPFAASEKDSDEIYFYEASACFVAPDHKKAEIKGLASPVRFSMYRATERALAKAGLEVIWDRHRSGGRVVKIRPKIKKAP